jgi:putative DNA primase/helicase
MKKPRKSNVSSLAGNSHESVEIKATVYHVTREESYYLVEYHTVDGAKRKMLIGREQFRKPTGVVDILLKAHADLPDDEKKAIDAVKDARRNRIKRTYDLTNRTGWCQDSFVYLTETFGELAGNLRHEGPSEIDPALGLQHGTLKAWREGLRNPSKYSDFLLFALSVPGSGPLLDIIGEDEGAIFHLQPQNSPISVGSQVKTRSTSGKTLAARAAMSEIGRCRKSDLVTFAATERAVEDYCFAHNHLAAVFDEEGRALSTGRGVKTSNLPYLVTGGVGTLRSKKATRDPDLQNLRWSLPALSSGETPLDDPARRAARPEGAQARMIPVPVPAGARGGIFNRVEGSASQRNKMGRQLAGQVEETISSNYGVLMPAYLAELVPLRGELLGRVRGIIDEFVDEIHANKDPWERRFAEKFGIVLAAALLMSKFGVAPWTRKRARIAVTAVYKRARAASASPKEAADALLRRLRKLVRAGTRFPAIQKGQSFSPDQAKKAWGVIWKLPNSKRTILVPYDRLKRLVQPSAITNAVLRELAAKEILLKADDGKLTRQVMIKGMTGNTKRRYVCLIRSAVMKKA